jgi:xylulokinase
MELLVGLDIGTTSAKAVLISPKGEILNKATFPYPLYTPKPGWVEQQPQDWWDATIHVLQKVTKSKRGTIVGLGITGQMHGAVFLDKDYKVIRPAILWNDARTGPQCRQIERIIGKDKLQQITGNPALAGFQAPKILWLREHEKRNYRKVRFVLLPKDYIRFKLTGELATDASDAAGTLLLDLKKTRLGG